MVAKDLNSNPNVYCGFLTLKQQYIKHDPTKIETLRYHSYGRHGCTRKLCHIDNYSHCLGENTWLVSDECGMYFALK